jgi:beta-glucosidase
MAMVDAGQGVRGGEESTLGPATVFPSGVALAATWDRDLVQRVGRAIGEEARHKGSGAQILLGPAINIHRSPLGGRNGEYFSEDPCLAAQLTVSFVRGVQEAGVAACLKHYACNNEETDRDFVNVKVGERALREIYLPAFEAGVKQGGAWAVMSAYNKVNDSHASANAYLLGDVLKKGWGFDGLVMSDWGGVHEATTVQAGNDLEMPGGKFSTVENLEDALAKKTLSQQAVDDSVQRILRTILRTGLLDGPITRDPKQVNSAPHQALALEAAEKGIVLLKNTGALLPLDRKAVKSIAVIGEPTTKLQIAAAGSAEAVPLKTAEILGSIQRLAGEGVLVRHVAARTKGDPIPSSALIAAGKKNTRGFKAEYFKNPALEGEPALTRVEPAVQLRTAKAPAPGIPAADYSVRWAATLTAPATGDFEFLFTGDDGFRVFLDDKPLIESWQPGGARTVTASAPLEKGRRYRLRVEFFQHGGDAVAELNWKPPTKTPFAEAVDAAKKSTIALVAVSTQRTEGEGRDRTTMDLPSGQADLIRAVAAANANTIVVLNNGGPVAMSDWIDLVPAVIEAWFPGQEGGTAIARILFGDVNPSGRLPVTFGVRREDYPDTANFPGRGDYGTRQSTVRYTEGVFVGYRHFDKRGIAPLFPFGHGLSYTTFNYGNLQLSQSGTPVGSSILVSVDVTNTGKRAGEEVVQLYVRDPETKTDRPPRELRGFDRVALQPGETKAALFTITPRDFAFFDVPGAQWKAPAGRYDIEIGASSRDIRLKTSLVLDADFTEKVPSSKEHLVE